MMEVNVYGSLSESSLSMKIDLHKGEVSAFEFLFINKEILLKIMTCRNVPK